MFCTARVFISYAYGTILYTIFCILYNEGVTNCCQISYAPPETLFEITEITRFLKSENKKIDMVTSKIL